MASLFISYSRKDIDFARKLTEAFEGQNLDFWIDWDGIPPTVDWWKEIQKGIEEADIFLFLISPDSAKSKICKQEIGHAVKNGKRLIPIVVRDVKGNEAPPELSHLNWIFLREIDDFQNAFGKLIAAIKTDYAWVQIHRRLQVRALEWGRGNKDNSFLLRGKDLQDAEAQLVSNAGNDPKATELQTKYVLKSRKATDRQRRIITIVATAVAIALAVLAVIAAIQAKLATDNAIEAQNQANIALSRQLTARSQTELLANHDRRLSLLFAIEAINAAKKVPGFQNIPAEQAFRDAIHLTGGQVIVSPTNENESPGQSAMVEIATIALSPLGNWLTIGYKNNFIYVWDLNDNEKNPEILMSSNNIGVLNFSPDGNFLIMLTRQVEIWDMKDLQEGHRIIDLDLPEAYPIDFSPDGQWLLINSATLINLADIDEEPFHITNDSDLAIISPQARWLFFLRNSKMGYSNFSGTFNTDQEPKFLTGEDGCKDRLLSPDGRWLAADCNDGINVWNMQDFSLRQYQTVRDYSLAAFSHDGNRLAIISDVYIQVLDLQGSGHGSSLYFNNQATQLYNLSFSPDLRWVAAMDFEGRIFLWDLSFQNGNSIILNGLGGFDNAVLDFAFTSDNQHLISISDDGITRKWDLLNPYAESLSVQANGSSFFVPLTFSMDGHLLAINNDTSQGTLIDLMNFSHGSVPLPISNGPLFFNSDVNQLISISETENKIYRWNTAAIEEGNLTPSSTDVQGIIIPNYQDNRWLLSKQDYIIQIWDLFELNTTPKSVVIDQELTDSVTIRTNGKWLLISDKDHMVRLWNLAHPEKESVSLAGLLDFPGEIKFSPKGTWIAFANPITAQLWNLDQSIQEPIRSFEASTGEMFRDSPDALTFSANEHWLAINKFVVTQIVDLENPSTEPISLQGILYAANEIAFSPNDQWLAARFPGSPGWEVRLWNLKDPTADPIILTKQNGAGRGLAFSPDGKRLAIVVNAINPDPSLIGIWNLDINELAGLACEVVGSNLSRQQWKANFPTDRDYQKTCPQWPEGKDKSIKLPR